MVKLLKYIIKKVFREHTTLQGYVAHAPLGIFAVYAILCIHWAIGLTFGLGFLTIEVLHEWRLKDKSYEDVAGFLAGIILGAIIIPLFL